MSKGLPWNEEDLQIIKDNYTEKSLKEIISMLSTTRTEKAIKHKASILNVRKNKNHKFLINQEEKYKDIDGIKYKMCLCCKRYLPLEFLYYPRDKHCLDGYRNVCKECKGENFRIHKVFTKQEEDIIAQYYTIKTNREIKNEFMPNKTLHQINQKANIMGLLKPQELIEKAISDAMTEERKEQMSISIIESGRYAGENNPMYGSHRFGSLNPNWNEGISELYSFLRRNIKQWKQDSMKKCNYKCVLTGGKFHVIHHVYAFESLMDETLEELNMPIHARIKNYSDDELMSILNRCLEKHYEHPLGVCLSEKYHKLYHQEYGYRNSRPEYFEEFKQRYISGEFLEDTLLVSSF